MTQKQDQPPTPAARPADPRPGDDDVPKTPEEASELWVYRWVLQAWVVIFLLLIAVSLTKFILGVLV